MKRVLAGLVSILLVSTVVVPAAAAPPDPVVVGLVGGLEQVAGWYAGEVATWDDLGDTLPVVDVTPGIDLEVAKVFGELVPFAPQAATPLDPTTIADLDDLVAAIDTSGPVTVGDVSYEVAAVAAGSDGLTFTVTIERLIDGAGFAVTREDDGVTPVDISSPRDAMGVVEIGVPVELGLTTSMTVSFVPATATQPEQFSIDASDAPTIAVSARIDGDPDDDDTEPDPFVVDAAGVPAAIGLLDTTVVEGSTLALDVALVATLKDTDGDGVLQFVENTDDGSGSQIPGEMLFALDDLVGPVQRTGTAGGALTLEPRDVQIGDGSTPVVAQVTVDGPDLAAGDVTVVTDTSYDDIFADFLSIDASDLLGGLGQLFMASSLIQGDPGADIALPFLGLSLDDVSNPAAGLAAFVLDQTVTEVNNDNLDDPDAKEFGDAKFDTLGELLALLESQVPGIDGAKLAPVYDPATETLDLQVAIANPLGAETPIIDGHDREIGWLDFGDTLKAGAGIGGLQHDIPASGAAPARARSGGSVDFRWAIDLQPGSTDCDDPSTPDVNECDDPATTTIEETEDPPVYERFGLRSGPGNEIEVMAEVRVPTDGMRGTAGWIEVEGVGGDVVYAPTDSSGPAVGIDLGLPGDGSPQSVHSFLQSLASPGGAAANLTISRDLGLTAGLELQIRDGDGDPVAILGDDTATAEVAVSWPAVHDVQTAPTVTPANDAAQLLAGLDYDPSYRTALFGRVVDTVDGLMSQVGEVGSTTGTSDFAAQVPLLGRGLDTLSREAASVSAAVKAIRTAGPPATLQQFETAFQSGLAGALGSAAQTDWLTWSLDDVGNDGTPDVVFALAPASGYSVTAPIALALPGAGQLFGAGGAGGLTLAVEGSIDIGFPVEASGTPLPAPGALLVRRSSRLDLDASAALATNQSLTVNVGGVEARLGPDGAAKVDVGFDVEVAGAGDGPVPAAQWLSDLQASLVEGNPTCGATNGKLACVEAPMFLDGSPVSADPDTNLLKVSVDDLSSAPSVTLPSGLAAALAARVLDLSGMGAGLDQALGVITRALDASEWGASLPFLGDDLTGGADAVGSLSAAFDAFASAASGALPPGATVGTMRTKLEAAALGLPPTLLKGAPVVTLDCSGSCNPDDPATAVSSALVEVKLGQGDPASPGSCSTCDLPFDLGLPGLPLRADGKLGVDAGWQVDLGFGVDRQHGAFVLENPFAGDDPSDTQPEIRVGTVAVLDADLEASLGVFGVTISSDPSSSKVDARLAAFLRGGGGGANDRIPAGELLQAATGNLAAVVDPTFDIAVGLDLALGAGTTASALPGLTASLTYASGTAGSNGAFDVSKASIELGEVNLHLGEALGELLGAPLGFVGSITEPVEPVLDFLTAPIPVLSDLSRKFGGGDVTMLGIVEAFGGTSEIGLITDIIAAAQLADAFANAGTIKLADKVVIRPTAAASGRPDPSQAFARLVDAGASQLPDLSTNPEITGASGKLSGQSAVQAPLLDDPGCLVRMAFGQDCDIFTWTPDPLKVEFKYEQAFGPFFGVLYVTLGGWVGAGAKFGLGLSTAGIREVLDGAADSADDAFRALNGLYIRDFDGPEVYLEAGLKAGGKLDVLVASAGVEGGVKAALGFDLKDPVPDGRVHVTEVGQVVKTPLCLFDVAGKLSAFLDAYATLGIWPLKVRKTFHLAQITLFDFSAALSDCTATPVLASRVNGFSLQGSNVTINGQDVPLVRLNMGPNTSARNAFKDNKDETFVVRQLREPEWDGATPVSPGLFQVTAFGHTQDRDPTTGTLYEGYAVVFNAGDGDDNLLFEGGTSVDLDGSGTFDPLATPTRFTAPVHGDLGPDNDVIRTGEGDDVVYGGSGDDAIVLMGGDDEAHGGSGRDVLDGGAGDDHLSGDDGDDELNGGPGADTLDGGADDDVIFGGADEKVDGILLPDLADTIAGGLGDDIIYGGQGNDQIRGDLMSDSGSPNGAGAAGGGNDTIYGEDGNDTVWAGDGDDTVYSMAGADTVYGQGGNDTIWGGEASDFLAGGPGHDTINGEDGHDRIWGDTRPDGTASDASATGGNDRLYGGEGSDRIDGGGGVDEIHGGPGNDAMVGGRGGEVIFRGGSGDDIIAGDVAEITGAPNAWVISVPDDDGSPNDDPDVIHGDAGNDIIHGQSGNDRLHGGSGDDLIKGNAGNDEIWGDGGNDELHGNAGNDQLMGGPGHDLVYGRSGSDHLYGHEGNDRLIGGSAAAGESDAGDVSYGGEGHDVLLGDNGTIGDVFVESSIQPLNDTGDATKYGADHLNGGAGRDVLHGQEGNDTLYGEHGDDQLFGEYGDDVAVGGAGHDVILGDRGRVIPAAAVDPSGAGGPGRWPGGAPQWDVELVDPNQGGKDTLFGRSGHDGIYGGWADDYIEGGSGDDHLEGNGGRDTMYGHAPEAGSLLPLGVAEQLADALDPSDEDDMIGGSSDVNPLDVKLDEGEYLMFGNEDEDVMAGDNANIVGVVAAGGTSWDVDDVTGGRLRSIELFDRDKSDDTPIKLSEVSGGDLMYGNDGNDRLYGQGGTDILKGNAHDDFIQGNQDRDLIEGNDGDDDLIGGSEFLSGRDAANPDQGDHDAGDEIYGGAGADVILGDNGIITRVPQEGVEYDYVTTQLGIGKQRWILMLDVMAPPAPGNSGPDVISGGEGVDVLFGQDDRDIVAGGPHDDYMEGNGDQDWLFGDRLVSAVKADPPTISLPYETLPADIQADLGLPSPGTLVFPPAVPFFDTCPLDDDQTNQDCRSALLQLEGPAGPAGQDDQLGGSSRKDFRDDGDVIFGDGAQDVQLGDNGRIDRTIVGGDYARYDDYNPDTIVRQATRYDVGGAAFTHGRDVLLGGTGDDTQYGQDGNDVLLGEDDNDDQYGELGDDWIDGGRGEDAQIGDRGVIVNRLVGPGEHVTASTGGPMFFDYVGLREGTFDRRVDLLDDGDEDVDGDGDPVEAPGLTHGGDDIMLGGPGHDVMHGAYGDDVMLGNGGGDWMFGADGRDVMWGGHGCVVGDPEDGVGCTGVNDPGAFNQYVDILFGGHSGGTGDSVLDADMLDYRPRPDNPATPEYDGDPLLWHLLTGTLDDVHDDPSTPVDEGDPSTWVDNDHHHGVDWIYGGYGRDVMQGDVGQNGPEPNGDRLIDWVGTYNLYTRCNASYGDDGDVRQRAPAVERLLETMAYGTGVGSSLAAVRTPGTSAYRELALVYKTDTKDNNGKAFPGTPGHFAAAACLP